MELGGILHIAKRWAWALALATCLAGLAGYIASSQTLQVYESRATVLVGPINTDMVTLRASGQLASTYAELVTSRPLLQATVNELRLPYDADELRSAIRATADIGTRLLIIRVSDEDPDRAATIANDLADRLSQLSAQDATRPEGSLTLVDAATEGTLVATRSKFIVVLAALAGAIGALAVILMFENLSEAVRTEPELAELTSSEYLGSIPRRRQREAERGLAARLRPDSPEGDAYRLLATKIELSAKERPIRSLLLIDVRQASASGELTANIAVVLASRRRRITLVDANRDTAEVTALYGLADQPGLADLLREVEQGDVSAASVQPFSADASPNLAVVPVGRSGLGDRVEATPAPWLVNRLLQSADLVLVNSAPVDRSADALIWARAVDATVLVVRRGKVRRADVRRVTQTLELVGAHVIGAVFEEARARGLQRLRLARIGRVKRWSTTSSGADLQSTPTELSSDNGRTDSAWQRAER